MQDWAWGADGAALAMIVFAGVAEHRRHYRRNANKHGWMPWRGLQAAGFFALIAMTMIGLKR